MADFTNQSLKFHSDAVADNTLLVSRLQGDEQMSGLFRFSLDLISTDPNLDLEAILYQPAKIGIEQRLGGGLKTFRWFNGVLETFKQAEQGQSWTTYRAVLVPDLWKLSEFYRSRVFQKRTVDQLVTDILKQDIGLQSGTDFEFKLNRAEAGGGAPERKVYPEREYIVQYEETDLNVVHRWLEHEGIFYYFENDGTGEKVVFADSVSAYTPVNKGRSSAFPYRPQGRSQSSGASQGGDAPPEEVLAFEVTLTRKPKQVALNDYNWRDPSAHLATSADIETNGIGKQTEYNDHFKTPEQGKALADVRAQEWTCRAGVYRGQSTCHSFRPGKTFDLEEHFRGDFNRNYLLTAVRHEADQAINLEASTVTGASYTNQFEAIPSDLDFRPERLTEWPCIKGTMHARVDAEGDGEYAEIDEYGRYKLSIPFDEAAPDAEPGEASRWVRMAQPYAGANAGFHFPLLKGAEVLLTHIDGDPDRPIIAAAVPNPEAHSPVDSENSRQNKIVTASGNMIIIDDSEDLAGFVQMDASGSHIEDNRQPVQNGGGGGGGGETRPGRGGEAAAPRRPESIGLKLARKGGRPLPAEVARRLGLLRPGRGDDPGTPEKPTSLDAYKAFWPNDTYVDDGLDALQGPFTPPIPPAPVSDPYTFTGKRADQLKIFTGNVTTLKQGDAFTYADVTHSVGFGTGGYSYKQEDGDSVSESKHTGNKTSTSTLTGNSLSTSTHTGDKASTSTHTGNSASASTKIGNSASASINIGNWASSSIKVGNSADASITTANKVSTALVLGNSLSTSINLSQSASASICIGKSATAKINISKSASAAICIGKSATAKINISKSTTAAINIGKTSSAKIDISGSSSATIALSASEAFELKASASAKLSISASSTNDINIFAASKFKLDISSSSILELSLCSVGGKRIKLGGKDTVIDIPAKTKISLEDHGLTIKRGDTQVDLDVVSLITKIT